MSEALLAAQRTTCRPDPPILPYRFLIGDPLHVVGRGSSGGPVIATTIEGTWRIAGIVRERIPRGEDVSLLVSDTPSTRERLGWSLYCGRIVEVVLPFGRRVR